MRRFVLLLFAAVVVHSAATLCHSQVVAHLDDDFKFVLTGTNVPLSGVELRSTEGGLVPVGQPAPFQLSLSNTPNYIALATTKKDLVLDGSMTLDAGWDPVVNDQDVTVDVSLLGGSEPTSAAVQFGSCEACPLPLLRASVIEDGSIMMQIEGIFSLSDISFQSPSGSLRPAPSAAPFSQLTSNTPHEVAYTTTPGQLVIDGALTMNVGWGGHPFERDIEYTYALTGQDPVGPTKIKKSAYDLRLEQLGLVDFHVNELDEIVVTADAVPLSHLVLASPSGSLLPSNELGGFAAYGANTTRRVAFEPEGDFISLDGELVLPTGWNWRGSKDVTAIWRQPGELRGGKLFISPDNYPDVPVPGKEPVLFTLDENNNFVITGIGQDISAIHFSSPTGALRPSGEEKIAPFPVMLTNEPDSIILGVLGGVLLDGSFVTDIGPVSPDRLDEIEIEVGYSSSRTSIPTAVDTFCSRCNIPGVMVEEDGGLALTNMTELVMGLTFTSRGDHLTPIDLPPGVELASSSPFEFSITSADGFDSADMEGIEFLWAKDPDSDVFFNVTFLDGTRFGPFPVTFEGAVPEPSGLMMLLSVLPLLSLLRGRD